MLYKNILFSNLMIILVTLSINFTQAMDKSESANVAKQLGNVMGSFVFAITDPFAKFIYHHPYVAAFAVAPFVPNKIAPIRRVATECQSDLIAMGGIAIRANLFHIVTHQYLKERMIKHKTMNNASFLLNECSCEKLNSDMIKNS